MKNNFEAKGNSEELIHGKYSPENVEFFNNLAEKYGLDQDIEHFISTTEKDKEFILKRHFIKIRREDGKEELKRMEDYLEERFGKNKTGP